VDLEEKLVLEKGEEEALRKGSVFRAVLRSIREVRDEIDFDF